MCFGAADGKPLYLTDHDASSPTVACYRLSDVTDAVRLGYYAARLMHFLGGATPPVP